MQPETLRSAHEILLNTENEIQQNRIKVVEQCELLFANQATLQSHSPSHPHPQPQSQSQSPSNSPREALIINFVQLWNDYMSTLRDLEQQKSTFDTELNQFIASILMDQCAANPNPDPNPSLSEKDKEDKKDKDKQSIGTMTTDKSQELEVVTEELKEITTNIEVSETENFPKIDLNVGGVRETYAIQTGVGGNSVSNSIINIDDDDDDKKEEEEQSQPAHITTDSDEKSVNVRKMSFDYNPNNNKNDSNNNNVNQNKAQNHKQSKYEYKGQGFEVFLNNKQQSIFTSTMLFCAETFDQNEKKLVHFLSHYGHFKRDSIEQVLFKRGRYGNYALIRVRDSMKNINYKIKTLNAKNNYQILSFFERGERAKSNLQSQAASNTLYVNNFDIINKETHRKFTELFVRFGELTKDIKMGLDKNGDPYALVEFDDICDAITCFHAKHLRFGQRVLSIQYSKYLSDDLYI